MTKLQLNLAMKVLLRKHQRLKLAEFADQLSKIKSKYGRLLRFDFYSEICRLALIRFRLTFIVFLYIKGYMGNFGCKKLFSY